MFSFHKPKVYRSTTGCCICKAKSSSSRFTDSKKYEDDFVKCFQLDEHRTGEICNACVLLVKRWKKLPAGSSRNWRHVVDARAGPGIKSLTKFKAKNKKKMKESSPEKFDKILKKKHTYSKIDRDRENSPAMSDDLNEEYLAGSPAGSDDMVLEEKALDNSDFEACNFIDRTYFKKKVICCGIIYLGQHGELIINPDVFKPCLGCLSQRQQPREEVISQLASSSPTHSTSSASASPCHSSASASPAYSVESNTDSASSIVSSTKGKFSDCSSDSGYDDLNSHEGNRAQSANNTASTLTKQPNQINSCPKQREVSVLTAASVTALGNRAVVATPNLVEFAIRASLSKSSIVP